MGEPWTGADARLHPRELRLDSDRVADDGRVVEGRVADHGGQAGAGHAADGGWAGTGELWLDPARATDGGRDLAAAGRHLGELRSGAGAEVAAHSGARPWGTDDIGQAFERNYRPIEQQVLQAWGRLGGYVEGLGDGVVQAVREAVHTDHNASVRVEHT